MIGLLLASGSIAKLPSIIDCYESFDVVSDSPLSLDGEALNEISQHVYRIERPDKSMTVLLSNHSEQRLIDLHVNHTKLPSTPLKLAQLFEFEHIFRKHGESEVKRLHMLSRDIIANIGTLRAVHLIKALLGLTSINLEREWSVNGVLKYRSLQNTEFVDRPSASLTGRLLVVFATGEIRYRTSEVLSLLNFVLPAVNFIDQASLSGYDDIEHDLWLSNQSLLNRIGLASLPAMKWKRVGNRVHLWTDTGCKVTLAGGRTIYLSAKVWTPLIIPVHDSIKVTWRMLGGQVTKKIWTV